MESIIKGLVIIEHNECSKKFFNEGYEVYDLNEGFGRIEVGETYLFKRPKIEGYGNFITCTVVEIKYRDDEVIILAKEVGDDIETILAKEAE